MRRPHIFPRMLALGALMVLTALCRPLAASGAEPAIPQLSLWQSQMITYGHMLCDYLAGPAPSEEKLANVYYDATRVFYQIARYTGDASWNTCAQRARAAYRDYYVIPNGGGVPGYMVFTTGLRMDHDLTGNAVSRTAAIDLAHNAAYAPDTTPLEWTQSADLSREVAYAILSYINAEALGEPARARRIAFVDQAYDHMDQWFVRFGWQGANKTTTRIAPFMVGLTAHSLIRDWEETADPRLIPALERAADWMFANAWIPAAEAMWYDNIDLGSAADLNLLIAPMYAFLYRETGNVRHLANGDALFAGGVKNAWLVAGKQFDQNYWWSFDYVDYRSGGTTVPPAPVVGVTPASISFTGVAGGVAPASKSVQISNTGTGTLSWNLSENSPWFSATPTTGTGAGTVTIVPNTQGLSAGSYTGTLRVLATGAASKAVPVTLTLTSPTQIAVAPASISFTGIAGGAAPASKTVQISNTGPGTLSWSISETSPWFSVATKTGSGAGTVTIVPNTQGLSAGTYTGTLTVSATGAASKAVSVTLTLTAGSRTPPVIAMSKTSVSFKGVPGGALPAAQNVQISNGGGGTLAWTAEGSPWLKVTKTGTGTLKVEANSAGLPAGRYGRVIKVKAPGAAEATIPVTLTLTPPPVISVSKTSMSFRGVAGGALPAAQTFNVSNVGGGTLAWTAQTSPWLKVTKTSTGTVKVVANTAGLPAGRYGRVIKVTASGAATVSIPVTLTVTPPPVNPVISVSPASISFTAVQGGAFPAPKSFTISNTGGGTLSWKTFDTSPWFDAGPTVGTNTGTVWLLPHTEGLLAGTHSQVLTVTAPGASMVTITVKIVVTAP